MSYIEQNKCPGQQRPLYSKVFRPMGPNTKSHQNSAVSVENFQFPIKHTKWLGFLYTNHVALLQLSLAFPLTLLLSKKYIYTVKSQAVACFGYSRVWNKRSPLNKHSPWKICLKE